MLAVFFQYINAHIIYIYALKMDQIIIEHLPIDQLACALEVADAEVRALFPSAEAYDAYLSGTAVPCSEYLRYIEDSARELETVRRRISGAVRARDAFQLALTHASEEPQREVMAASLRWVSAELSRHSELQLELLRGFVHFLATAVPVDVLSFRGELIARLGKRAALLARLRTAQARARVRAPCAQVE